MGHAFFKAFSKAYDLADSAVQFHFTLDTSISAAVPFVISTLIFEGSHSGSR